MISDVLFEALEEFELYERTCEGCYKDWADDIRRMKLEMCLLQFQLDVPEPVEAADVEWLRTEALRRTAARPCYEFVHAFIECVQEMWARSGSGKR